MKIAINCCYYIPKGGGIKEYIYNLVTNIIKLDNTNEYVFYIYRDNENYWQETMPKNLKYKTVPFSSKMRILRSIFQNIYWLKEYYTERFDIFHSPFFYYPTILPCKSIITVHDLRFKAHPQTYEFLRRIFLNYAVKKSIKKTKHIITISNFSKNDIINYFNVNSSKITVIHEAVDLKRFKISEMTNDHKILTANKLIPKKYFLCVGHLEPRKNLDFLINSFNDLKQKNCLPDFKLVIVGKKNHDFEATIKLIEASNTNIAFLDFISENDLFTIYQNAYALIFPSIYEGFGFPILEAAAFDVPALCSNITSLPEIGGEGALYFDPYNAKDLQNQILNIVNNTELYNNLVSKAKINLTRFSWEKNARETLNVYNKI